MLFFPLINVKMPTTVGILTFMSRKNFMLIEHEKSFIISGPGFVCAQEQLKRMLIKKKNKKLKHFSIAL